MYRSVESLYHTPQTKLIKGALYVNYTRLKKITFVISDHKNLYMKEKLTELREKYSSTMILGRLLEESQQ